MRAAITYSIRLAILAVVAGFGGLTHAWAQGCPASPSYSPDFTAMNCLTLNPMNSGSPSFAAPVAPTPPSTLPPNVATVLRLTANQGGLATSAWYDTQQDVADGFSTTFAFQIGHTSTFNADGFAFVIQNSSTSALGPGGCGIGLGPGTGCSSGVGIPNSVAIEFNTYPNGSAVDTNDSSDSVTIQNCGTTSRNSVDVSCSLAAIDLTGQIALADNTVHVVTVTYTPSINSNCGPKSNQTCSSLHVVLDGVDLFPGGVLFDLHTIGLSGSNAWVGFTAGTGGGNDDQDILTWTFTPQGQSVSGTVNPGQTTTFNFNGGFKEGSPNSGYNFSANPSSQPNGNMSVVVTAIPILQQACNNLLKPSFAGAECFVYQNGGGPSNDMSVLFEVTCPPSGSCGSNANPPSQFIADLGTQFSFNCSENVPLLCGPPPAPFSFGFPNLTSSDNLPEVGFLKGEGPDPIHPCAPYTNGTALFQSNQLQSFALGDTSGGAHGASGGTTSCWVLSYLTPGELPTISITRPASGALYLQGSATAANFACSAVDAGTNSPVGPYLKVSTCTAADSPGGVVASGAQFDTSTLGPHTFTVQVQDSATNTNQQSVNYTVVTGAAPASGTKCNGVYYGVFKGNIAVLKGQSCTFISGGVTGSIAEFGGSLSLTNATVGGGIGIIGGSYFIGPATIIKGDVAVLATPASALQNQVCRASIGGSLTFLANGSPVAIGSNSPVCPGNTIGGSLIVDLNFAATSIFNNTVGGSLLDQGNSQPTQVYSNHVSAALNCSGDKTITGGGNTATKKLGQCATF